MSIADEALRGLLLELEKRLMDGEFRRDRERVSGLLHKDFREFGSSGRVWSREAILDLLATEPWHEAPGVEDFEVSLLSPEMTLVTYRAVGWAGASLRSSLWVREGDEWRVIFHQGTKVPTTQG